MAYIETNREHAFVIWDDNFDWEWLVEFDEETRWEDYIVEHIKQLLEFAFAGWYLEYFNETPTEAIENVLGTAGYKFTVSIMNYGSDD